MSYGTFTTPTPVNEPVQDFAPGSPERASLQVELKRQAAEEREVPIIVGGKELTDDRRTSEAVRREVGMVFQQFNLFPHLSVMENLTMAPIYVHGTPEDVAEDHACAGIARLRAQRTPGEVLGAVEKNGLRADEPT